MSQIQQRRQAVSGVLAAVILIAITVVLAALVLTFGTDFTENALNIDIINVVDLSIKNTGSTSYLHATVKNTGSSDLSNAEITIFDSGSKLDVIPFSQTIITTGDTASVTIQVTNQTNSHYLPYGKEVLVQIKADTPAGTIIETDPTTVRVSKN